MKKNTKTFTLSVAIPAYLDFEVPENATDEKVLDLAQKAFDAFLQNDPDVKLAVYNEDMDTYAIEENWMMNNNRKNFDSIPWCMDIETRNGTLYYI